jgi:hypothetical protein
MCGGELLQLPCSHVGHIFRTKSPYDFPGGAYETISKNMRRVIDVWTDDYSPFLIKTLPGIENVDPGDLTERKQLRIKLQCKSFQWYLDNIYPETHLPQNFYHVGQIQNVATKKCIDGRDRKTNGVVHLFQCGRNGDYYFYILVFKSVECDENFDCFLDAWNQVIELTRDNFLKIESESCIATLKTNTINNFMKTVSLTNCKKLGTNNEQRWIYDENDLSIRNMHTNLCLSIEDVDKWNQVIVNMDHCDNTKPEQQWKCINPIL